MSDDARVGVPAASRARDALALGLVAAGAGVYFLAWRGMNALAEQRVTVADGETLVARWDSYRTLSLFGLAGIAAGVAVAGWSFYRHRKPAVAPR